MSTAIAAACAAPAATEVRQVPLASSEATDAAALDAAACDRALRADAVAARNIRSSVDFSATGIASTNAAIALAAGDETADVTAIGIPLRVQELLALEGMSVDAATPLAFWVNAGRPDLFGGIWIDPPGSRRYVVSIVDGDPGTQALARCLERPGLDVRYVVSDVSGAELRDVQDRVSADWQDLKASGIRIISSGVDTIGHRVEIEVEGMTAAQARVLQDRYGPRVQLVGVPVPEPPRPLILTEVPLAVGTGALFSQDGHDDGPPGDGRWTLTHGRLEGRELVLEFAIVAPVVDRPDGGAAVVFAGMGLFGGSGDVGFGEEIDDLVILGLPACDPTDCRFEATVRLPADVILPAVRRLEARVDEVLWLNVEITLVRTFEGGERLQVMAFGGDEAPIHQRAGTLAAVTTVGGPLWATTVFPAEDATPVRAGEGMFTTDFDYATVVERVRMEIDGG